MKEIIEKKLQQIPEKPGVYRMLDKEGRIIYIGKSKCLKKRVNSYFVSDPKWEKAKKMVGFIHDIDITVTDTHLDAMLLECAWIKKIQPYFNVLMKNDQRYVYLKIEENHTKSSLKLVNERDTDTFGPLRSKQTAEEVILAMRNLYPIEKAKRTYHFTYHILPLEMNKEQYEQNRNILLEICRRPESGKRFIKKLQYFMGEAAEQQRFELAMRYRDLAQNWEYLLKAFHAYEDLIKSDKIYVAPTEKQFKYFYIRKGLVVHTRKIAVHNTEQVKQYAEEIKDAEHLPVTEEYLQMQMTEKSTVDFRTIVYGELYETAESTAVYEV